MAPSSVEVSMRGAFSVLACVLTLAACAGAPPTSSPVPTNSGEPFPSPTPSATAGPSANASATANPSPTISIGPDGLPTSVLGLPVLTVAAAQALVDSGAADGRFMAVGGYWYSYFLPCAFQPHIAPLADHCGYGVLTDEARNPDTGQPGFSPAMVTESAASFSAATNGGRLVVIVHVADDRFWQCPADQRADCTSRPVLDRMVWADGQEIDPTQFKPPIDTNLMRDDAMAAALAAAGGGQVVLTYPIGPASLNDVDPRFVGKPHGLSWYTRIITGTPDANGTAAGTDVLVDDASGRPITMPLAVDLSQQPARLVLDENNFQGGSNDVLIYSLMTAGIPPFPAEAGLGSTSTPLVLPAGDYTARVFLVDNAGKPKGNQSLCDLPISLAAGDDVAYYADFDASGTCTWKPGSFPFN